MLTLSRPVSFKKLASLLDIGQENLEPVLSQLDQEYKDQNRGWRLSMDKTEVQLVSNPENAELVEKVLKSELKEELTPAALETVAVVAYKGPIKKSEIDFIRGVNSAYTLRSLMIRGLISRKSESKDGRIFSYFITTDFLNYLGLRNISGLYFPNSP